MTKTLRKTIHLFLILALLATMGGCSLRPKRTASEPFRLGFSQPADNLNPYGVDTTGEAVALSLLYDTLFVYDPTTGECAPGLCIGQSISENADGTFSWDLEIRSDVLWHDGKPLTAKDVMFTLKTTQLFSRLYGSPNCDFFYGGNMTVMDDTHLSFVVWEDYAHMAAYLADIPILPEHIWNTLPYMKYTEASQAADHAAAMRELPLVEANAATMIGSGPWRWGGYKDGVCRLLRNENHWNGAPSLESVELVFDVSDPMEGLLNQSIHAAWDVSANAMTEAQEAGFLTGSGSSGNLLTLEFNLHRFASNSTLREAVDAALNREEILTTAFGGGYVDSSLMPPGSFWQNSLTVSGADTDPAWLLEQNGYIDQNGDGYRDNPNGTSLSLELIYPSESARWAAAAECIRTQCSAIGIDVHILAADAAERSRRMSSGEYDMLLGSWHVGKDPAFLLGTCYWNDGDNAFFTADDRGQFIVSGWNASGYANEDYDRLYEQFIVEKDTAQRQILAKQLAYFINQDRPILVLGWPVQHQACASQWKEFHNDSGLLYTAASLRQILSAIELK